MKDTNKKKSLSNKLSEYISNISFSKIPPKCVKISKLCILDLFGAHFSGLELKSSIILKKYISNFNFDQHSTVWCLGSKNNFLETAFVNTALSHLTIFDDMHAKTASHYGSILIPAAFALGEYRKCSGKELINSVVCGYEAGINIGKAMIDSKFLHLGFRPSGTFGVFASTATAAKLLKNDVKQMTNSFGLAANFCTGIMAFAREGTNDLMYHNALASRNGIMAALMGKYGTISPNYIFEIKNGFFDIYGGSNEFLSNYIEKKKNKFRIEEIYFKSIPACAFVQSPAEAVLKIVRKYEFELKNIVEIQLETFPLGKNYPGLDFKGPFESVMQAQMSNPFTIASILVNKDIGMKNYINFKDAAVNKLAKKVVIKIGENATLRWPDEQLSKIRIILKDGVVLERDSENPHFLNENEIIKKCEESLNPFFKKEICQEFIEKVLSIEKIKNINEITNLIKLI